MECLKPTCTSLKSSASVKIGVSYVSRKRYVGKLFFEETGGWGWVGTFWACAVIAHCLMKCWYLGKSENKNKVRDLRYCIALHVAHTPYTHTHPTHTHTHTTHHQSPPPTHTHTHPLLITTIHLHTNNHPLLLTTIHLPVNSCHKYRNARRSVGKNHWNVWLERELFVVNGRRLCWYWSWYWWVEKSAIGTSAKFRTSNFCS